MMQIRHDGLKWTAPWTFLAALTVLLAMVTSASAEVDTERFYPISISCPAGPADESFLVSANAAGRYTRMAMKGNRLTLSVRHQGTDWKFRTNYDVAEDEIDRRPEERTRTLLRNSLQALRDLKRDICDGTTEYFARYQQMLADNRRITGAKWPISE